MRIFRQLAFAALIAACTAGAAAQKNNFFRQVRMPRFDKYIAEAVLPAISVVRSTYFVADDNEQRYRAKNDTVFGREYSLCVMTTSGPVFSDCAEKPWDYDARFDKYRNNPAYKTRLNDHTLAPADGSGEYKPFVINEELWLKPIPAGADSSPVLLGQFDPATENVGLATAVPAGAAVEGIIMWFTYDHASDTIADRQRVNITYDEATLNFGNNATTVAYKPLNAPDAGDIIGSIFLMPVTTAPGVLEFRLGAFIVPPSGLEDSWTVLAADLPSLGESVDAVSAPADDAVEDDAQPTDDESSTDIVGEPFDSGEKSKLSAN